MDSEDMLAKFKDLVSVGDRFDFLGIQAIVSGIKQFRFGVEVHCLINCPTKGVYTYAFGQRDYDLLKSLVQSEWS